jgi:hypothetical protein
LVFENPAQALKNTAADSDSPWIKLPELPVKSEILKSVSLIDLPIAQTQLVLADSAARRGRLSAMPLKPLRTGAAHVVQLRSITVHENAHDFSADSQEEHPRTPPHKPQVLTRSDGDLQ